MWLIMAAPIGVRTVRHRFRVNAPRQKIWDALYPFGAQATWHHSATNIDRIDAHAGEITTGHVGRDGEPIQRSFALSDLVEGSGFALRYTHDTSLADSFWAHHHQSAHVQEFGNGTEVTLAETDRYRGLAFIVFRFFAMRRMARQLKQWAETGHYKRGGLFDRVEVQFGMAILSTLLVWPLFGLNANGLFLAATLTTVVALHELGHVAAFRISGHKTARMVFLPLLGGLAMGGRPYNSHFEIAFAALMGAGFSAFLVVALWFVYASGLVDGVAARAVVVATLICAVFNLGNILPVWKFDGGQILRQIFRRKLSLMIASSVLLLAVGAYAVRIGLPAPIVFIGIVLVASLSLITGTHTVKPRSALVPMTRGEGALALGGLLAVLTIHGVVLQRCIETIFL